MPYFVYQVRETAAPLLKELALLKRFTTFKDARRFARDERATRRVDATETIKVMFADTELQAEEQLLEARTAPVLREWEK